MDFQIYDRHLNPQQEQAAAHREGPLLVIAGAGSGKTRIVTCRIARLLASGVPPHAILALTFTNKAAGEMRERVRSLTEQAVLVATFHSLGARILRESASALGYGCDFTIYDQDDAEKLLKTCLEELGIKDRALAPRSFAGLISNAKNRLVHPEEASCEDESSPVDRLFPDVYRLYQRKLKECNAVDFDDLLYLTAHVLKQDAETLSRYQQRWQYVLIDEYQDTNHTQYTLARLLVQESRNLFVVGDPDQSIYSWRGANIRNILDFQTDYPGATVVRLEQNYRSRSNILNAANALISRNRQRLEKNLWSMRGEGEKIAVFIADDERMEADFVARQIRKLRDEAGFSLNEMVIFYRTNFQSRVFEDALLRNELPYVIVGGLSFYQRKEIKDILAFLRLVHSSSDLISFMRTVNLPKRGLGATTLEKIARSAAAERQPVLIYCLALVRRELELVTGKLSQKQRQSLEDYLGVIAGLRVLAETASIRELVAETIVRTRYFDALKEDPETFDDRKENVEELVAKAAEWEQYAAEPTLQAFLEELSLMSAAENLDQSAPRVHLMTLHNGKGLEFEVAFLVGMEEDLLPHANCRGDFNALEEERRLCYVGMTRAKERLYVTAAQSRYLFGTYRYMRPSRFLTEIPKQYLLRAPFFHQPPPRM